MTPYLDGLLRNLHAEAPASRVEALRRLRARVRGRQLRDPRVRGAVASALDDPHQRVRRMAGWIVTEVWDWHVRAGRTPEPPFDDAAVLRLLNDSDPLTRIIAAERMAGRGDDRAVPVLADLLSEPHLGLLLRAADAAAAVLEQMADDRRTAAFDRLFEPLLRASRRPLCPAVWLAAFAASRDPRAVPHLLALALALAPRGYPSWAGVVSALAGIAAAVGSTVVDLAADYLDDPRWGAGAATVLGAIARLDGKRSSVDGMRPAAVACLVEVGLRHPSEDVRWASVEALGDQWDADLLPALVPMLDDPSPDVAIRAVRVLGRFRGRWIDDELRRLITDQRPVTRQGRSDWVNWPPTGPVSVSTHVIHVLDQRERRQHH
jgi:HEAT repeat protein